MVTLHIILDITLPVLVPNKKKNCHLSRHIRMCFKHHAAKNILKKKRNIYIHFVTFVCQLRNCIRSFLAKNDYYISNILILSIKTNANEDNKVFCNLFHHILSFYSFSRLESCCSILSQDMYMHLS
jgi:hypothetical protein